MHYLKRTFTLPSSERASEKNWDFAFLSESEFIAKYGEAEWNKLSTGCTSAATPTMSA